MNSQQDEAPHVFPEGRKPGEMVFCILIVALTTFLLLNITSETAWIAGKKLAAQPRFWPALSLGGALFFAALNWWSRAGVSRNPGRWRETFTWIRSLEFIGYYMLYVASISVVGYLLATILFCIGLTLRLGYRRQGVLIATCFALFVVLFFKSALNVKIPGGAIYELAPEGMRYILFRYF
ncbi:tripartite tricarboxylate transporter TctB family protein [Epibacterium sp. SM1979]|uniref:Tripartite tricarboxylate transporter TctB family protein n=1 Tax=Tritonibacter litoralis TaxID=2662264 RepID=A0A843YDT6_9RHOB|nr:tripartite tricarboxylate transporter TctB family protein [Tritonibacter litoralis]MQQ07815.1 tripartite tricarboxylate transporter TctB family protein [Tritonibacter litoralis]